MLAGSPLVTGVPLSAASSDGRIADHRRLPVHHSDRGALAQALNALDHHGVAFLHIALYDHQTALPADDGDVGAARRLVLHRPDEGAAAVPLHGESRHGELAVVLEIQLDGDRHARLQRLTLVFELGFEAERPRRLVDAVVDAGDAAREERPGQGLCGGADLLVLHDARGETLRHLEIHPDGGDVVERRDLRSVRHEVADRDVGEAGYAGEGRDDVAAGERDLGGTHLDLGEIGGGLRLDQRRVGNGAALGQRLRARQRLLGL